MRLGGTGTTSGPRAGLLIALAAGAIAGGVVLWMIGSVIVAAGFVAATVVIAGVAIGLRVAFAKTPAPEPTPDWSLAAALAGANADAVAVTGRDGHLVCANPVYETLCGGFPTPPALAVSDADLARLTAAGRDAWRDGQAVLARIEVAGAPLSVEVTRSGHAGDHLVWRFAGQRAVDTVDGLAREIDGALGDRLGAAGIMAALMTPSGEVIAGNRVLCARALGQPNAPIAGQDLAQLLVGDAHGTVHFARDEEAGPLRLLQVALSSGDQSPVLVALVDDLGTAPAVGDPHDVQTLLSVIPFGLALVDREGRFIAMNAAFARMAGVEPAAPPLYPGDLVVREDKAAVADAVRRFTTGGAQSADLAIRLKDHPDEPVALSIAATRGFGGASVLLSFKENGEENRLKREVAQATKMQAVGQLAGGVAHDFNNILTAIIGHCDLMLMRHSPGDSDYDDIQQIRANSNRAASLTRQLLAFSRQQTLRPQVLQLPDVVSEVSTLLRRLLGEARADRFAAYVEQNIGALVGNFFFGFLLGGGEVVAGGGGDAAALQKREVSAHFVGGLVPVGGVFRHRRHHHGIDVEQSRGGKIHLGHALRRWGDIFLHVLISHCKRGFALERGGSGDGLIEHATQRIHIGAGIRVFPAGLFRRKVLRSTNDRGSLRHR